MWYNGHHFVYCDTPYYILVSHWYALHVITTCNNRNYHAIHVGVLQTDQLSLFISHAWKMESFEKDTVWCSCQWTKNQILLSKFHTISFHNCDGLMRRSYGLLSCSVWWSNFIVSKPAWILSRLILDFEWELINSYLCEE